MYNTSKREKKYESNSSLITPSSKKYISEPILDSVFEALLADYIAVTLISEHPLYAFAGASLAYTIRKHYGSYLNSQQTNHTIKALRCGLIGGSIKYAISQNTLSPLILFLGTINNSCYEYLAPQFAIYDQKKEFFKSLGLTIGVELTEALVETLYTMLFIPQAALLPILLRGLKFGFTVAMSYECFYKPFNDTIKPYILPYCFKVEDTLKQSHISKLALLVPLAIASYIINSQVCAIYMCVGATILNSCFVANSKSLSNIKINLTTTTLSIVASHMLMGSTGVIIAGTAALGAIAVTALLDNAKSSSELASDGLVAGVLCKNGIMTLRNIALASTACAISVAGVVLLTSRTPETSSHYGEEAVHRLIQGLALNIAETFTDIGTRGMTLSSLALDHFYLAAGTTLVGARYLYRGGMTFNKAFLATTCVGLAYTFVDTTYGAQIIQNLALNVAGTFTSLAERYSNNTVANIMGRGL